jgi:TRAP-type C4-dicarboxylate transport system substrate-binding protein
MKKLILLSIMLILAVGLFISGCGGTTTVQTTTATMTATQTTTQITTQVTTKTTTTTTELPVYELRMTSWNPEAFSQQQVAWAKQLEEMTGGRLKIKFFFGGSLATQPETLRAVQTGVADIGYYTDGTDATLTPLSMVLRLPFLGVPSMQASTEMWAKVYNQFPAVQKEWESVMVLHQISMPGDHFHFTKKSGVRSPADIKGMKIISRGLWPDVMKGMGVSPLDIPIGDWYTSLDTGLAEGYIGQWVVLQTAKTIELLKHHTQFFVAEGGCCYNQEMFIMNKDSFNKLPPDLQKALVDSIGWLRDATVTFFDDMIVSTVDIANKEGHTFVYLTKPEEIQPWVDATSPVYEKWINDNADRGPTQEILDYVRELAKEYQ